ncbi:MAG: hypothetical protein ACREIV_00025, partial [Planctomycetaceae bacterium]
CQSGSRLCGQSRCQRGPSYGPNCECRTCGHHGGPRGLKRADDPVGSRQKHYRGLMWPPYPRPTGDVQDFTHKYHHAHYWPHPYNCWDMHYVNAVTGIQVANGWRNETTLYDHNFDPVTQQLTHSGLLRLEWILDYAPPAHRVAYVQEVRSPEINQQRLAVVTTEATLMAGPENLPPIVLRRATALGRPAVEVQLIRERDLRSIPDPRIEYEALPSGTGGGG